MIPNLPYRSADRVDAFFVWPSELNYYMTEYGCNSLEELDATLWVEYGVALVIL